MRSTMVSPAISGCYHRIDPASTVPRAVVAGLLTESEVPASLLAKLQNALEYYRLEATRSDADPPAV